MAAYATRVEKQPKAQRLDRSEYKNFDSEQFKTFARIFLKDNTISTILKKRHDIDTQVLNQFFESLPDHLLTFSTEMHKKLIHNYIVSNLHYGFKIEVDDYLADEIFGSIRRLAEVDPRLSK